MFGPETTSYIQNKKRRSQGTAKTVSRRLKSFETFVAQSEYKNITNLLISLEKDPKIVYTVINGYVKHLIDNHSLSNRSLSHFVNTAKDFLEYCDIEISQRKFANKVTLPRINDREIEGLSKEQIIKILYGCNDRGGRLRTYVLFLASSGCRPNEPLTLKLKDLRLESNPPVVLLRGENTKTGRDRYIYPTEELVDHLRKWIGYKYRTRRVGRSAHGKYISWYVTPDKNENMDLVFAARVGKGQRKGTSLYDGFEHDFALAIDRIGMGEREEKENHNPNSKFVHKLGRKITLHSFRRFAYTTVKDLTNDDFADFFIGHEHSTYYRKPKHEREEKFKQVAPHLTFLDFTSLHRQEADSEHNKEIGNR